MRLNGGEIRRDERRFERPLDPAPGRAVPSPKVPQLERRKAMRCSCVAVAGNVRRARQDNCASRRSTPLIGAFIPTRTKRENEFAWLFENRIGNRGEARSINSSLPLVGRVGQAKQRPGWGGVKRNVSIISPPDTLFASLTTRHPPHKGEGKAIWVAGSRRDPG